MGNLKTAELTAQTNLGNSINDDIYVEEQIELSEIAGTWGSASTFSSASTVGTCAASVSSSSSASSFG
jgi:hypothetical protein